MTRWIVISSLLLLISCAAEVRDASLDDYEELAPATVLAAPAVKASGVAPHNRDEVEQGKYLVELLGCGACHTNGALMGRPDSGGALAGSDVGIAFTTPLQNRYPAIVYAPNITPDHKTGIGGWTEDQVVDALRGGSDRHGARLAPVMPWPGYSKLSDEDAYAIASYLQHIDPVAHQVPDNVPKDKKAKGPYVYFGVYQKK